MASKHLSLEGKTFGRLTVLRKNGVNRHCKTTWICRCNCYDGACREVEKVGAYLLQDVKHACNFCQKYKNSYRGSPTYTSWKSMRRRCRDSSNGRYHGRGIEVCKRWDDFLLFLEDMGERPEGTTIDRIDNDGNYEPSNCRWATNTEQKNNYSQNVNLTYGGKTLSIAKWSRHTGLPYQVIWGRIKKSGWSVKDALTTPVGGKKFL